MTKEINNGLGNKEKQSKENEKLSDIAEAATKEGIEALGSAFNGPSYTATNAAIGLSLYTGANAARKLAKEAICKPGSPQVKAAAALTAGSLFAVTALTNYKRSDIERKKAQDSIDSAHEEISGLDSELSGNRPRSNWASSVNDNNGPIQR